VRGFRDDWERDGATVFRWTTPAARIDLPVHVKGEGLRLRLRARRHFLEPAQVRLGIEGRTVAQFEIQAGNGEAYRVYDFPLPPLEGRHAFSLSMDSSSGNPRPLGLALDWMELEAASRGAFAMPAGTVARGALVGALAVAVPLLAGAGVALAGGHGLAVLLALFAGAAADPLAVERVLRNGAGPYAIAGLVALLVLQWLRSARRVSDPGVDARWHGALAVVVLAALALRLALLLHPRFYYPDVRIHALFVRELARNGFGAFMAHFTDNQFRYSLGLQFEGGHWYAFPYPPVFYLLCGPLVTVFRFAPEVAVALVPAIVNSLEALVVYGIARRLRLAPATALGAAACVPLLPLFVVRLSLAYFPAITGHAVDALVVLAVLAWAPTMDRKRALLGLAALIALALLTYTQSLVNLGLMLPLFLVLQVAFDRGPGALRRHAAFAVAGALGALLALGLFYSRYVPALLAMRSGVAMAGESIVLERLARLEAARPQVTAVEEQDDPYAQPTTDLWRGVRKSVHRVRIFYGPLALAVALGFLVLIKRSEPLAARFVAVWGATFVLICIGSGGLPGPNLLRYAKELELIAPLCMIAVSLVGAWLWSRSRLAGAVYALGAVAYAVSRLMLVWAERVMTLAR
jgi:hypothetical protein